MYYVLYGFYYLKNGFIFNKYDNMYRLYNE